ncbi:MAG TPA: VWA domain-containing protein [Pyrinomonadaceae bacterium]|nr:VWA domain-containing protein [Pyrinomonadaceae bacterium]
MNSLTPFIQFGKRPVLVLNMLASCLAFLFCLTAGVQAQEVADTIKVNTRVVFMDALVKDKRTGVPISDLKAEHFQVLDDGTPRTISYFTREGQARKPLALVLILDLRSDGAGRYLKRPEVLKVVAEELAKLSPQDEVAILAMDINGEDEKRLWLSGFTRDPKELVAALARAPQFIDVDPATADARAGKTTEKNDAGHGSSITWGSDSSAKKSSEATEKKNDGSERERTVAEPKPGDAVEVEVVKGKNGATVTRTTRRDGSIAVKRTNKDGDVVVDLGDIYDLAAAVKDTTRKAKLERPNSQLSIVYVSDGINPIFFEDRDATQELLIHSNAIFNSLTAEMRTLFKLLMPIAKPIAGTMGISVYGASKRLAQQTGGEAVKVSRVKDFSTGLSRIIGNLTARYSLGFALAEDEQDDGRLHNLEVRVKAPDAKGKLRKLEVSSRQGYYMSETQPKPETAAKAQ